MAFFKGMVRLRQEMKAGFQAEQIENGNNSNQ